MKVFGAFVFATIAVVGSAPTLEEVQVPVPVATNNQEYYRDKRSQYPQYVSPCAAAAASGPIPAIAPASYQVNVAPYRGYNSYGYAPHYRTVEMEPEMLSFSDVEHMPMARYGYVQPAPVHPAAYAAPAVSTPAATTGTVFSVFPNANTGGCSVPLLLSCQPSVVSGHVVQTQPHYYAGDNYRGVEAAHHETQEAHHEEQEIHDHISTAHEPTHAIVHQ